MPTIEYNPVLTAALAYAATGIPVFPCRSTNKAPCTGKGGFKKATTNIAQINKWWAQHPDAMIGIPTGTASGIFVVDLDIPKQANGELTPDGITAWEKTGLACETYEVQTGSGGRHIYFKYDESHPVTNKEGWFKGQGINIRGNGGYVIAPPSRNSSGGLYKPVNGHAITDAVDAPPELYKLLGHAPKSDNAKPTEEQSDDIGGSKFENLDDKLCFPKTPENIALLRSALPHIPASDRNEHWLPVGMALHTLESEWGDAARKIWDWWSKKFDQKGKFDPAGQDKAWEGFKADRGDRVGIGTLFYMARLGGWVDPRHKDDASVNDFYHYRIMNNYIYSPTGELWPKDSVNAHLSPVVLLGKDGKPKLDLMGQPMTVSPATWLKRHRFVQQITWAPGEPQEIKGRLICDGGWLPARGCTLLQSLPSTSSCTW